MYELQPPQYQLGFFWNERSVHRRFVGMCEWLSHHGFAMAPDVVVAQTPISGCAPPRSISTGCKGGCTQVRGGWGLDTLRAAEEWMPVLVAFSPLSNENIPVQVGYAAMDPVSYAARDVPVIEVVVSGAHSDLLMNVGPSRCAPEVRVDAERTDAWISWAFRKLCDDCNPDYAAFTCETELLPPAGMVRCMDEHGVVWLYLASRLCGSDKEQQGRAGVERLALESWEHGALVYSRDAENGSSHRRFALALQRIAEYYGIPVADNEDNG